jgi:opacity protein-like surface antigen
LKHICAAAAGLFIILSSGGAAAQDGPWSVQLSVDASSATQELAENADLGMGLGLEAMAIYGIVPYVEAYASWDWHHFPAERAFDFEDVSVEETGYAAGLRFRFPMGSSGISYLFRAGGTFNHIEIESDEGDIIGDTDHGLGWELGAGLIIPLGEHWRLSPGARYRALSKGVDFDDGSVDAELTYVAIDVGFTYVF